MRHPNGEPSDLIRSISRALRVLEAIGQAPGGLTVKQIARRCELTTATTYHLVRTLAYEGYVLRSESGTYLVGLEISNRFQELSAALRGPTEVTELLRRAARQNGYSHCLGRFVAGRVVLTSLAEGSQSPHLEDLVPGFHEGAHATALGKALLATMQPEQRLRYLKDWGMRKFTSATITEPEALDADLATGERRGMQIELGQFRPGVACAAVLVHNGREAERRVALACTMPAEHLISGAHSIRTQLLATARVLAESLAGRPGTGSVGPLP